MQAIQQLEMAADGLAQDEAKTQVQSACLHMRYAVARAYEGRESKADQLALLLRLPEALISCQAPSITMLPSDPAELAGVILPGPLTAELRAQLFSWNFDLFTIPAAELPSLCFGFLMMHDEVSQLKFSRSRLWNFVVEVESRYRKNPFHSFRHAVDVCLASSFLIRKLQTQKPGLLDAVDVAAFLVAAIVHDIDHPGVMNGFLTATRHPLAVLYNDRSVLENHHSSTASSLLLRPELNFLLPVDVESGKKFKKHIVDLVLATDVTTTMPFAKSFEQWLAEPTHSEVTAARAMQLLIKASDISNPSRALPVYEQWVVGVMQEFFRQGDAENELGLPYSMNCDQHTVNVDKCQVGFIQFLVEPLFKTVEKLLPNISEPVMRNLSDNKAHYQKLASAAS